MKTYKKYIIRAIVILILFLFAILMNSCNRYFDPERYANPRHRYEIRTTRGERQMNRLIRQNTYRRRSEGCGYQK